MLTPKELLSLIIVLIILAFSRAFLDAANFIKSIIFFAVILIIYMGSKKAMAYYVESEEESRIWSFQRYGFTERSHFKNPVPIGIILPFILTIISLGTIPWYATTESEIRPLEARAVRRHDFFSFAEMTEYHLGIISAAGVISMFFLAIIAYIINIPELSRLSIYFACFNLLPLGKLDGTKIFFGTRNAILWIILAIISVLGLLYAVAMP